MNKIRTINTHSTIYLNNVQNILGSTILKSNLMHYLTLHDLCTVLFKRHVRLYNDLTKGSTTHDIQ